MAPLEPWEKVLVNTEDFEETEHGKMTCTECHQGILAENKEEAHTGLVARPSADYKTYCKECHATSTVNYRGALHYTQEGYWTVLEARSTPENHPELEEMFGNHCASCHTSCGDCHVSQPTSVGGGLIDGHVFKKTPSMSRNCTACHGSRVGNEYLGKHEGLLADVHFRQGRMVCVDCHDSEQMHMKDTSCVECHDGTENPKVDLPNHRYDGPQQPACDSCHERVTSGEDGNPMHVQHSENLSCQVCHSVDYKNCTSCHVAISETSGKPFFETGESFMGFLIGKNPIKTYHRPYDYVPLRHVPIDTDSFSYYGDNLLPNFDALPTWVYATPHNIQLQTPQNKSCSACHGNADIFLTIDKVAPEELEANKNVYLEDVPDPFNK